MVSDEEYERHISWMQGFINQRDKQIERLTAAVEGPKAYVKELEDAYSSLGLKHQRLLSQLRQLRRTVGPLEDGLQVALRLEALLDGRSLPTSRTTEEG